MTSAQEKTSLPFFAGLVQRIMHPIKTLLAGEGLKAKVFRGGAWLGTGSFSEQVVRFGRNMVLARLLAPEAFGMMAVVLSGCSVIHTIMDIGVKEALIQNPRGSEDEYVGAAWWMAFGRAISFGVCLLIAAPFIARFYGNAELSPLFRVSSIGVFLDGAIEFSGLRRDPGNEISEMGHHQSRRFNFGGTDNRCSELFHPGCLGSRDRILLGKRRPLCSFFRR